MVFLDTIRYHVHSEGQIVKKAVYIAIGVNLDGRKDVPGMWVGENGRAKFWATVLNGLKNRGVEDIFIYVSYKCLKGRFEGDRCCCRQAGGSGRFERLWGTVGQKILENLLVWRFNWGPISVPISSTHRRCAD